MGVELGKLIEPQLEPYTDSLRSSLGGNSVKPAFILLLIIVSSGVQPVYGAGDGFYGETVVGLIDEKGMGVLIDMFMDSEASIGGVDWDSTATEGLMVSVLATHDGIIDAVDIGILADIHCVHDGIIDAVDISEYGDIGSFDPSSMLGIIPSTALVSVYLEVPLEVAESRADEISEAFSSFYGIPVARMLSFEQELPLENFTVKPTVSIVVYQSSAILEDVASQVYAPFSGHGGLVDIIEGAVDNSRLIPGKTEDSADGTALVTGFINAATILDELMGGDIGIPDEFNGSETIEEILPLIDGPVVFSGGVSIWEQGVEITPEGYSFDLLGLLGFTSGDPEFSEDADFSFFGIFDLEENEEGDINPNGFVAASLPSGFELDNITDDLGGMGDLIFSSPGDSIPSSNFNVPVTGESLPLMVEVSKEVSYMSTGDRVQVTVTVENMDMDAMVNVNLDDSATNNGYPLSVSIQSGITTGYWATIQPGASESIIYTLELGDPGIYSLSKAQLEYNHNDKEYTKTSNSLEVKIDRPNPLSFTMSSFGLWWRETTELLDMPTGGQGGTILSGAVLLGLAVLGILEVLNIRKWLQG